MQQRRKSDPFFSTTTSTSTLLPLAITEPEKMVPFLMNSNSRMVFFPKIRKPETFFPERLFHDDYCSQNKKFKNVVILRSFFYILLYFMPKTKIQLLL